MNDKHWVDTNILIYSVGDVVAKKTVAIQLLKTDAVISTQVINEAVNVMHRKLKYDYAQIRSIISEILKRVEWVTVTDQTIFLALEMAEKYRYHYFDSLMIASALCQRCRTLYSEDLQPGQVIENRLRIINPFHVCNHLVFTSVTIRRTALSLLGKWNRWVAKTVPQ